MPARPKANLVMNLANSANSANVAVVELSGSNHGPTLKLLLLGLAHVGLAGEDAGGFAEFGTLGINRVEDRRQLLRDQRLQLAQRSPPLVIQADKLEAGRYRSIGAHRNPCIGSKYFAA